MNTPTTTRSAYRLVRDGSATIGMLVFTITVAKAELLFADHALVDRIVNTADGSEVGRDDLETRLRAADFVIIGEKHDNARHHAIQAELVDLLGDTGELTAVAFEMLPRNLQLQVTMHVQDGGDAAGLADAIGWSDLGWGPWTWYGPIVHAAMRHRADIVAGDLSRTDVRAVYDSGFGHFDARFVERTGLDVPLAEADQVAREAAMVDAHCGHEMGDGAAAMVSVQRARDAMMADRLVRLTGDGLGVLITGNGHADANIAVPPVLERLVPGADVVSLGLIEIDPVWTEPPSDDMPYDFVWLTPRAKPVDFDYCAQLNHSRG